MGASGAVLIRGAALRFKPPPAPKGCYGAAGYALLQLSKAFTAFSGSEPYQ
jgi:hypothetical protein